MIYLKRVYFIILYLNNLINVFPKNLIESVKKGWELLNVSLKEIGIKNSQAFINMIFVKIIELMNNLDTVDTVEKFDTFEKSVNDYIIEIITNKDNIDKLNKDYEELNGQLLNLNPQSIKEIIQSSYDPSIYSQNLYPDIQYYSLSEMHDLNSFIKKFNSLNENISKYPLINIIINKDSELTNNANNMKNLVNINKLSNLLLNIYSYKISREDAKLKKLKNEISFILDNYNKISNAQINEKIFYKEYIIPFINSWNQIKSKSVQYKCKVLIDINKGEKPLDITDESLLCYFLIDNGEKNGLFLASAYEQLIDWQNEFIDEIISKNKMSGILNSYVPQLEKEINIQDATKYDIINIDENIYKNLNELISSCSMRNIFNKKKNMIDYNNYNDIIYDYDFIEEELGKLILPGLKKFKKDKITFITYLYEGLRGENSSILIEYNNKYIKKELIEDEKTSIIKLIKKNNNKNKFIQDIFSSLQILMNEILKENYNQDYLIYNIIEKLPHYIILNEELVKMIKNKYKNDEDKKSFNVNSLVSIFEYLEDLNWNEIKKNIPQDYQIELDEEIKRYILNYFDTIKDEKKIITKINFVSALRKLISRFIAGTRLDIDIKEDAVLNLYIKREDLWNKKILEEKTFEEEIERICKNEILIKHCWCLYNLLEGDENKYEKMNQNKKNKNINRIIEENEFEINTSSNQKNLRDNNIIEEDEDENDDYIIEEENEDDDEEIVF